MAIGFRDCRYLVLAAKIMHLFGNSRIWDEKISQILQFFITNNPALSDYHLVDDSHLTP
jgi:hypothetical protein